MDDGLSATAVPHCAQKPPPLLTHVQELSALQVVVQGVDATGLLACWDYLAFPLMLITDSVRPARMQLTQQQQRGQLHTQGTEEASEEPSEVAVPAAQSDRVAEAALGRNGLFSLSVSCSMRAAHVYSSLSGSKSVIFRPCTMFSAAIHHCAPRHMVSPAQPMLSLLLSVWHPP